MYLFSPSNNAFYPESLREAYENAGTLPSDLISVDSGVFSEFSGPPPDGMRRAANDELMPCWEPVPVIEYTAEQIKAQARRLRNDFISATDRMVTVDYTINDRDLTDEQQDEIIALRAAFKAWPSYEGWPNIELPEIPLWILIEAVNNGYAVPDWPK